jgi:hypothetical protein
LIGLLRIILSLKRALAYSYDHQEEIERELEDLQTFAKEHFNRYKMSFLSFDADQLVSHKKHMLRHLIGDVGFIILPTPSVYHSTDESGVEASDSSRLTCRSCRMLANSSSPTPITII